MCDIVMKGGITSGVVYPGAVVRLARRYRFRSIGGTSAGAIAAAIVAAAEHARQTGRDEGFEVIERLPGTLGSEGLMLQLFQADRSTRPLFDLAIACMGTKNWLRRSRAFLFAFRRSALAASAAVLAAILAWLLGDADWAVGMGVALFVLILLGGVIREVLAALRAITANDFGLCRLGPAVGTQGRPALTTWLHQQIQEAAMRSDADPLTFADLWGVERAAGPASADLARLEALTRLSHRAECRRVDLHMITTDLTQGRPMRLPALYDRHRKELEDHAGDLLFDRYELRRFFPPSVVRHLVACAQPLDPADRSVVERRASELFDPATLEPALRGPAWDGEVSGDRLLHLPIGPDLPVVVATRMSLSFPILIASVPLWRIVRDPEHATRVERVRFSDGGITSNFPIHFFDSPLPRWPTFGLDLTSPRPGERMDVRNARACVERPPSPGAPARERMREIDDLAGFAVAVKDAAQNWRDNSQARLPGFRDRIAHIKLAKGEGGLNLKMKKCVIRRLNQRGTVAGDDLCELFSGPDEKPIRTDHWDDHRFARYRVTMAVMERLMKSYRLGYTERAEKDEITTPYAKRLVRGKRTPPFEFETQERLDAALAASQAYAACGGQAGDLDDDKVPGPPAMLRTVPPA